MTGEKVVLAYSGGLDTSVIVKWLKEKYGYEVVTLTVLYPIVKTKIYEI